MIDRHPGSGVDADAAVVGVLAAPWLHSYEKKFQSQEAQSADTTINVICM